MKRQLVIILCMLLGLSACTTNNKGISKPETKAWDTSLNRNVGIHDPSIFVDEKDGEKIFGNTQSFKALYTPHKHFHEHVLEIIGPSASP